MGHLSKANWKSYLIGFRASSCLTWLRTGSGNEMKKLPPKLVEQN